MPSIFDLYNQMFPASMSPPQEQLPFGQMLGGGSSLTPMGDPAAMPGLTQYLQDVLSGKVAANALPNTYDPAKSFAANVRDPAGIEQAMGIAGGFQGAGLGIKAYHGSPYDFDRFDMSKVGTGEGAQAYGHGLYLAENEPVAEAYRTALAARPAGMPDAAYDVAQFWLKEHPGNREAAAKGYLDYTGPHADQQVVEYLRNPPGHMYEASINAEPKHFLDWDKPISEQPKMLEALTKLGIPEPPSIVSKGKTFGGWGAYNGSDLYSVIAERLAKARAESPPGWDSVPGGPVSYDAQVHDPARASQALRDAGIPGIRYLDQGSRGAGEGTHNYVVFDDKLIDILKKYGLAGLFAGGSGAVGAQNQGGF